MFFFFRFFGSPCGVAKQHPKDLRWALIHQGAEMGQRDDLETWKWPQHGGGQCFCCFLFFWGHEILFGLLVLRVKFGCWINVFLDDWKNPSSCLLPSAFHLGTRGHRTPSGKQKVVWWGICFLPNALTWWTIQWDFLFLVLEVMVKDGLTLAFHHLSGIIRHGKQHIPSGSLAVALVTQYPTEAPSSWTFELLFTT